MGNMVKTSFWARRSRWPRRGRRRQEEGSERGVVKLAPALREVASALDRGGSLDLLRLWEHWEMVMGPELAELAFPLGHRKDVLVVGVEDHLAQQEVSFQTAEILERVNAFLDAPRFSGVQLSLMQGRPRLDSEIAPRFPVVRGAELVQPPAPEKVGGLLGAFDPDSPLGRCYRSFVKRFGG